MQELHAALIALQEIDEEIRRVHERVESFTPRIEELTAPADAVRREIEQTQTKLNELRAERSRLEQNAQQKEEQLKSVQERLAGARNPREEAAARAEVDLVRRALEADRADLRTVGEQATRTDLKLDDLQKSLERARSQTAEQQRELEDARGVVETELRVLQERRENQAVRLDPQGRRLYEQMAKARSRRVLAPMTAEGACGNCFNILPLQEQTEVRRGETLHRCEACGIILYSE